MAIDVPVDRFKILFQLAKELPNVNGDAIRTSACSREDAEMVVRTFRSVRGVLNDSVVNVRICVAADVVWTDT
ncbi:hypothetical protein [Streptomyces sedi]|uniref:Uncharacterized protein n=1 Tax=Streptomyces sedi TaxID=555059 RepID=A0A5C4UQG0_9ACTN|nr:hypothetical protein [Streptomyces sedi]TNM25911.1 hypothetical protein FH715_25435 [Streptomyces sedi]